MRHRAKRYFALLLAVMMMFTALPATALAEDAPQPEETAPATEPAAVPEDEAAPEEGDASENEAAPQDEAVLDAEDAPADEPAHGEDRIPSEEEDAPAEDSALPPEADAVPGPELSQAEQVQALIDALPDPAGITEDTRAQVEAQLAAIDEAKLALTDGERAMLDVTRYDAAAAAILALDGQAGADALTPIENINGFEWTFDDATKTITFTGEGELHLPPDAKPGQRLPLGITSVVVNGASSIGEGCFKGWSELESVKLGPSVTKIDSRAFYECTRLSHLRGCGGLETIGDRAFYDCEMLQFVELPASVTTIGEGTFYGCRGLALQNLPAGVTSIGKSAFCMCHSLRLTSLPAGLTTIEEDAFYGCASMVLTELPAGVTTIGDSAFHGCESLALTELPDRVTSIGMFAFDGCDSITHLTLPAGLTPMGDYVFQSSNNLTTLTFLGTTAPSIDSSTFVNANGLREILIPEGATGYDAVHGWPMDKIKVGHTVTVNSALGGSASAAPTYAGVGDTIVLTATPDPGYHLKEWQTMPEVTVTDNSFIMPDKDVAVTPVFALHDFSGAWKTSTDKHWRECSCGERRDEGAHTYTNGECSVCGNSFECDIFVKTLSGGHTTLHVNSTDTVLSVKEKLKASEGIPVSIQVLKLPPSDAELEDDQCLADCGVRKDSTLHLTLRYAPGGEGTADAPYLIPDRERLEAFRYYINSMSKDAGAGQYFKLTADIDLEDEPWSPIGTGYGYPFGGTFDGGGHTIRGLNINGEIGSKNENLGFFRVIGEGGTVKDLTVAGSVTGGSYAGGVAGENEGTVENCRNTCTVSAPDRHAGGIAGCNLGRNSTVKNCSNTGAVNGDTAGGIVGENETTVEGCSNAGLITGDCVGGIVGTGLEGTIKNCSNAGPVEGNSASGIVNDLYDTTVENCSNTGTVTGGYASGITGLTIGTIKNCYNTGAVTGSEAAAGIVRDNYASTVENCYNTGAVTGKTAGGVAISNEEAAIRNCYNTGTVTGETTGGVVAGNLDGVVENCYYLDSTAENGIGNDPENANVTPKTAAQFASGQVAWLLQNGQAPQVWGQTVGAGTPELTGSADKTVYQITGKVEDQDDVVWYSNNKATLPVAPVRPGFAFEGWSTMEGGSVDFPAGAAVSDDMTVYAVFTDIRADGTGSVTMGDYSCGEDSVEPVAVSDTNGTANVTFTYSVKGRDEFSETKPTTAGEYTVKAVFAATEEYRQVTAMADFKITHQFNAGWEHREDGDYRLCACGVGLLLETKELTQVPEGLKGNPAVDTVEEIRRVLAEKVAAGDHYVVYDVELEAWIGGGWQIVTPESLPAEGIAITIPYPEGASAKSTFTVAHMFTSTGDGHVPGDTEILPAANGPDGIHFTVKSLSPIAIGWKVGDLTVTVADAGENADPDRQWHFRVELDDTTIHGGYGDMDFTDGAAEFTLRAGQSITARELPEGVAYTVTELNGDRDGYTTAATDAGGVIPDSSTATVAFTNTYRNTPRTGDDTHFTYWLGLLCLSLTGMAAALALLPGRKRPAPGRHARR